MENWKFYTEIHANKPHNIKSFNDVSLPLDMEKESKAEREIELQKYYGSKIANLITKLYKSPTDLKNNGVSEHLILATIQNEMTKYFVHTKSRDAVGSLHKSIADNLRSSPELVSFLNHFLTGEGDNFEESRVVGAKSEAYYIRRRADELSLWNPDTHEITQQNGTNNFCKICTNNESDAFNKVDVIEVHYSKDAMGKPAVVDELRFVQVKSKEVTDQNMIEKIKKEHQVFLSSFKEFQFEAEREVVDTYVSNMSSWSEDMGDNLLELTNCVEEGDSLMDVMLAVGIDLDTLDPDSAIVYCINFKESLEELGLHTLTIYNELEIKIEVLKQLVRKSKKKGVPIKIKRAVSVISVPRKPDVVLDLDLSENDFFQKGIMYRE